jgi:hypothetical protein
MRCQMCQNLERALEARRSEYIEASSLAYFRVSKKFAAYMNVEMERALIELQEHRSVCRSITNDLACVPDVAQLGLTQQDALRNTPVETAA